MPTLGNIYEKLHAAVNPMHKIEHLMLLLGESIVVL